MIVKNFSDFLRDFFSCSNEVSGKFCGGQLLDVDKIFIFQYRECVLSKSRLWGETQKDFLV